MVCVKLAAMKKQHTQAQRVLVLHGPNLNILGTREPDIYGSVTLDEINGNLTKLAEKAGSRLTYFQSNAEAELIDRVQGASREQTDFIIMAVIAFYNRIR